MVFQNLVLFFLLAWFSFSSEHLQIVYQKFVLLSLGIVFFLSFIFNRSSWLRMKNLPNLLFLLFILTFFVSIQFAFNKRIASNFIYLPLLSLFVYFSVQNFDLKRGREVLAQLLSFFAFLVFIFGLQEFIFHRNILYANFFPNPYYERYLNQHRMMSFHYHPSVLATFFMVCLPFSVYLIKKCKSKSQLILGWIGTLSSLSGIVFTFTRTVFGIVFVVSLIYLSRIRKKLFLSALGVGILSLVIFTLLANFYNIPERFSLLSIQHYRAITYRLERIPTVIKIWQIMPISGVGLGNFRYLFDIYHSTKAVPYEFKIPDNMYLSLLSETGLAGTVSFILFIFCLLSNILKKIRAQIQREDKDFLTLMSLGFVMLLLNMLSYDLFYWRMPLFFFSFYAGILSGYEEEQERGLE